MIPSISGIFQSKSTRLYGSCFVCCTSSIFSALLPSRQISALIPASSSTIFACSAATSSSSTISTRIFFGSMNISSAPLRSQFFSVTTTVNSVPTPFSDFTDIVPFIISAIFLAIAIPSPVLPYLLFLLESSCAKVSKTFGKNALSIPIPVSLTINLIVDLSSKTAVRSTVSEIFPGASVNFIELLRILINICFSFISSPI